MSRLLILACTLMVTVTALGNDLLKSHPRLADGGYNYWFYNPDTTVVDTATKPLIIFLHGKSLTGNDMDRVLRYGTIDAIRRGRDIDAYVLAPQNPGGSWQPKKVFDIVDTLIAHYPVDTDRIYVIGMSLGGSGTINTVAAYPDRIAAAMALCGAGQATNYDDLNKVPLWILHGTADRAVKIGTSERLAQGIRGAGGERMIYTPLSKCNHSILARAFYLPQTYDWLFSHSLADSTRAINRDYAITPADFQTAYNGISSPSNSTLAIERAHGTAASKSSKSGQSTASATSANSSGSKYYTVKKGDTLSAIAKRNHTTVAKLCSLNGISAKTTLKIGRKLRVK